MTIAARPLAGQGGPGRGGLASSHGSGPLRMEWSRTWAMPAMGEGEPPSNPMSRRSWFADLASSELEATRKERREKEMRLRYSLPCGVICPLCELIYKIPYVSDGWLQVAGIAWIATHDFESVHEPLVFPSGRNCLRS